MLGKSRKWMSMHFDQNRSLLTLTLRNAGKDSSCGVRDGIELGTVCASAAPSELLEVGVWLDRLELGNESLGLGAVERLELQSEAAVGGGVSNDAGIVCVGVVGETEVGEQFAETGSVRRA